MKKFTLLFSIFAFIAINSIAQVIYTEDFESLNVGEGIVEQVPEWWSVWSSSYQDAVISDTYAYSGTNSMLIGEEDPIVDVVLRTGNITENRYKVSFNIYIPEGKTAFYTPLHIFNPENSIYQNGSGINFYENGIARISGGGVYQVEEFSFEHNEWISVTQFFNLDNDVTDMFINEELMYSCQWSLGSHNQANPSNTLEGICFYGYQYAEFYIDDIVFEQVPAVNPAENLSLQLQNINDILVSWDAPESGTPESYKVYRNGIFVEEVIGTTSFTDYGLYPAEYEYYVIAYYGSELGYSTPSNTESIYIEGGVQRQQAILEIFTGTTCNSAGWIATSLNLLNNLNLDVTVLNYFSDDIYQIENMDSRMDYYVPYFDSDESGSLMCPSSIVDGRAGMEGYAGSPASQRNFWSNYINYALERNTLYTMDNTIELVATSPYTFNVSVEIEEIFEYYTGDFKVYMALIESNIEDSYQGISEINNLVRKLKYENVNFSSEKSSTAEFDFAISADYDMNNLELVVFMQHVETAEIVESSLKTSLSEIANTEILKTINYSIYPNPSTGHISIEAQNIQNISIINIEGKTIFEKNNLNLESISLNLNSYKRGIYIIKIITANGVVVDKLILK